MNQWYLLLTFWISICHKSELAASYKNVRLQDYLCADKILITLQKTFRGDPAVTLTEGSDSAAIISQKWNVTLPGVYSSNRIKYDCVFKVQTPEKNPRGIYTIVTLLKFRRDPATNLCLDYIQFTGGNRSPGPKVCNDIALDGPGGRLLFDERDRDMTINIHIDKRHMIYEPLELRIVLTAHSECKLNGDFLCDPKEPYSCISRYFVHDNITNCMFPCRDEGRCFKDVISAEEMNTANVALSALTSLIFTMLGVGFCLWVCWKYWNCITVQQRAHEASAAAQQRRYDSTAPNFEDVITANIMQIQIQQQNQSQDNNQPQTPKDLPPSYESLFPES